MINDFIGIILTLIAALLVVLIVVLIANARRTSRENEQLREHYRRANDVAAQSQNAKTAGPSATEQSKRAAESKPRRDWSAEFQAMGELEITISRKLADNIVEEVFTPLGHVFISMESAVASFPENGDKAARAKIRADLIASASALTDALARSNTIAIAACNRLLQTYYFSVPGKIPSTNGFGYPPDTIHRIINDIAAELARLIRPLADRVAGISSKRTRLESDLPRYESIGTLSDKGGTILQAGAAGFLAAAVPIIGIPAAVAAIARGFDKDKTDGIFVEQWNKIWEGFCTDADKLRTEAVEVVKLSEEVVANRIYGALGANTQLIIQRAAERDYDVNDAMRLYSSYAATLGIPFHARQGIKQAA